MTAFARTLAAAFIVVTLAACAEHDAEPVVEEATEAAPGEIRGVWLTNVDSEVLNSRESIAEAMQFLADHHFNLVYPVVWNKALTIHPSDVLEGVTGSRQDPLYEGRDPLQELIEEAAKHDIAVMPWFEFGFATSYELGGGPILEARPEWAARDAEGNLLTKNGFEWMNPYHPEVQDFMVALVTEVVERYDVAGVQGDDRLPANPSEGGYSDFTRALYLEETGREVPEDSRDPEWLRWRAGRLNAFAQLLYRSVKDADPDALVSWSPSVYPWSYEEYLQDWPAWIRGDYADLVHPQVYRYDLDAYVATLDAMAPDSIGLTAPQYERVTPGVLMNVGDYVIQPDYLLGALAANRERGFPGEVFFFYEGLRKNDDALADTLLATFYAEPAPLPF
jgi:uncharacterized lipoprotein YddW (UPF0748 family)